MQRKGEWFLADISTAASWSLLVGIPLVMGVIVSLATPFTIPMGGYWLDAQQLAYHGKILQHFTPAGYPELLAGAIAVLPSHPIAAVCGIQTLLQCVCTVVLWAVLRTFDLPPRIALLGGLLLGLHPELILSVPKVWDVQWSTTLFVSVVLTAVALTRAGRSKGVRFTLAGALGLFLGVGTFDRPNLLVLLPLAFGVLWLGEKGQSGPLRFAKASVATAIVVLIAAFTYTGAAELAYGHLVTPHNGPYNLYAGQNSYSAGALLTDLNGEPSIAPAIASAGYDVPYMTWHYDWLAPIYLKRSSRFMKEHPVEELELIGIKFFTLFRPDTKVHRLFSAEGLMKGLLALPMPIWLVLLLWTHHLGSGRLLERDWVVLCAAILYIVPFLLTNSDPRFRTPLDLVLASHSIDLAYRLWAGGSGVVQGSLGLRASEPGLIPWSDSTDDVSASKNRQERNTGILRCAQDDESFWSDSGTRNLC